MGVKTAYEMLAIRTRRSILKIPVKLALLICLTASLPESATLLKKNYAKNLMQDGLRTEISNASFERWRWDSSGSYIEMDLRKRRDRLEGIYICKYINPPGYSIFQLIISTNPDLKDSLINRMHLSGMEFVQSEKVSGILEGTIGQARAILGKMKEKLNRAALDSVAVELMGKGERRDGYPIARDSIQPGIKFGLVLNDTEMMMQVFPAAANREKAGISRP